MRDEPGPMTPERAPSRLVALDGAVNVRDIGGYRSVHGLEVMRGRLFRGDSLSQLTPADTARLDQLGLRTVIDFRTPGEVLLGGPDRLPERIECAHLPVSGGDLESVYELIASGDHERQRAELGDGQAASFMARMNRAFVTDTRQREAFGAALRLVCAPGQLPLLYHCTSSKDRSGWMTAIVLTAVGVPRELVLRDYLLSNDLHRTGYAKLRLDLVKEVATELKKSGIAIRINTDGQANMVHARNILPELAGLIDCISVSLNAADSETYVRLCNSPFGGKAFNGICRFLQEAKKHIPKVVASAVNVSGLNVADVRQLAASLGVEFREREYAEVG